MSDSVADETAAARSGSLVACSCCELVQRVAGPGRWRCGRCGCRLRTEGVSTPRRAASLAFSVAALILYFPAVLLPILRIEQFGASRESSLLGGTFELLRHGSWFVGGVVLVFSIVLPLLKIVGLLELTAWQLTHRTSRAWVYHFVELAGRWGMLDVLLLALLVMAVKVGELVEFSFGPGVFAFAACVLCNMLASLLFDPAAMWRE